MNDKKMWPNESNSAHEIYDSWLYYGDIMIRDTFVYEYTPWAHAHHEQNARTSYGMGYIQKEWAVEKAIWPIFWRSYPGIFPTRR